MSHRDNKHVRLPFFRFFMAQLFFVIFSMAAVNDRPKTGMIKSMGLPVFPVPGCSQMVHFSPAGFTQMKAECRIRYAFGGNLGQSAVRSWNIQLCTFADDISPDDM